MTDNLDELSKLWMTSKEQERQAVEARRVIEDRLLSLIGIAETLEGTEKANTGNFEIKVVGRLTRKVDSELLQELAAEHGLSDHLSSLMRWKPEINAAVWKATSSEITDKLLGAITTTPSRPSFTISVVCGK